MSTGVFAYCERGLDPGFWAEPMNALSNVAFLIAAVVAWREWRNATRAGLAELALIIVLAAIGIGSLLMHTLANRWAVLADVIPIGVFMLAYLAYALRRFLLWPAWQVAVGLVVFIALLAVAASARCAGGPCLNGSIGYLPALAALLIVGGALARGGHPAARSLLAAVAILALSLTLRTIDRAVCPWTVFATRGIGTHFMWHLLNGWMLAILVLAVVRYGQARDSAA